MTAPRYLNAVLTLIALLLTVIAFRTVPAVQAAQAPEPRSRVIGGIEGPVMRLLVWDEATNTVYEYGTNGKVRGKWTLNVPGEPLVRGR